MKTPILDGITKSASIMSNLKWGVGGTAAGVLGYKFGWPWFKNKYMGVQPDTVAQYGAPQQGQ